MRICTLPLSSLQLWATRPRFEQVLSSEHTFRSLFGKATQGGGGPGLFTVKVKGSRSLSPVKDVRKEKESSLYQTGHPSKALPLTVLHVESQVDECSISGAFATSGGT